MDVSNGTGIFPRQTPRRGDSCSDPDVFERTAHFNEFPQTDPCEHPQLKVKTSRRPK